MKSTKSQADLKITSIKEESAKPAKEAKMESNRDVMKSQDEKQ